MKPELKRELMKIVLAVLFVFSAATLRAANPDDKKVFSSLPIKEITVFKDGHAYVVDYEDYH